MIRGNFHTFVDLISPLKEHFSEYSVYANLLVNSEDQNASPKKSGLPVYDIEVKETENKEVCFLVTGLGEDVDRDVQPLKVNTFIEKIVSLKATCKEHSIVLAQKDESYDSEENETSYIILHLPIDELLTDSEDQKQIFHLNIIPYGEETEHIHYGIVGVEDSEGTVYKNEMEL